MRRRRYPRGTGGSAKRPQLAKQPWKKLRAQVRERDRVCRYCGSSWRLSTHHVTPYWLGGSDTLDNLVLACGVCHPRLDAAIRRRVRHGR